MLDLRPFLFANFLAVLLLVLAGLIRLNAAQDPSPQSDPAGLAAGPGDSTAAASGEMVDDLTQPGDEKAAAMASGTQSGTEEHDETQRLTLEDFTPEGDSDPSLEDALVFVDQLPGSEQTIPDTLPGESAQPVANPPATPQDSPAAKSAVEPEPPTQLLVRSNVRNAELYIDGRKAGLTGEAISLAPGDHLVKVYAWGFYPSQTLVDLVAGESRQITVQLERVTRVEFKNGEWKYGVRTGTGSWLDAEGNQYEGEFLDGAFHGRGRYAASDGTEYDGLWIQGKYHGQGRLRKPDGTVYSGDFSNGAYNGQGTLTRADGAIYTGYWVDGTLSGDGTLTRKDGTLYTGGFSDGEYHGNGNLSLPDGTFYQGAFASGVYQGKGELTYPDGKKYVGSFLEGQRHGQGILKNPNGSQIEGNFKFGKPFGVVTLTTAEGEVFTARTDQPGVCYRVRSYRATQCPPLEGW